MDIVEIIDGDVVILSPKGRIDSVTSSDFENKIQDILDKNFVKILVDFSGTEFMSSAGLRVLLLKAKQIKNVRGKLVLSNLNEVLYEIFEISGFATIFTIYLTSEIGIEELKK